MNIRLAKTTTILFAAGLLTGCAGTGPAPGTTTVGEPGPWEVSVVNAEGDTTSVPVGSDDVAPPAQDSDPAVGRMATSGTFVGIDHSIPVSDWEVTLEGGIEDPMPVAAAPALDPVSSQPGQGGDRLHDEAGEAPTAVFASAAEETPRYTMDDFTYGYRIQILAATSMIFAETAANRADSLFVLSAYVEYEPPFYKVRLGDFLLKEAAFNALSNAVRDEYPKAWVAETMVVRP